MATLSLQGLMLSIIQVYALTEKASEEEIEESYYTLNKGMETACKCIIIMGNFNAKVGAPKENK